MSRHPIWHALNKYRSGAWISVAASLAVLALALAPGTLASRGPSDGVQVDHLLAHFKAPGPRGTIHLQQLTVPPIDLNLLGLVVDTQYRLELSSARCRDGHGTADRLGQVSFTSNSQGAAFVNTTLDDESELAAVESIRLIRGTNQVDCARALPYQAGGTGGESGQPMEAFAQFGGAVVGIAVAGNSADDDLFTYALGELEPRAGYRLVASRVTCPNRSRGASRLEIDSFTASRKGTGYAYDASGSKFNEAPRSFHLLAGYSGGARVGCANATLLLPAVQA